MCAAREEEDSMFLLVFRGDLSEELKNDPLVCSDWQIFTPKAQAMMYNCNSCKKDLPRSDALVHSRKCTNQHCTKILEYAPVRSFNIYFDSFQVTEGKSPYFFYCNDCYSKNYDTLGTFNLDKYNEYNSSVQHIISGIINIPGANTKNANKV